MASFEWDANVRSKVVKAGWDEWLTVNREPVTESVRSEVPVLSGRTKRSVHSILIPGGPFGTRLLRLEAQTPWSKALHDGRKGFSARPGSLLTWITGLTGGRLNIARDGTSVAFRRVGPTHADPFIVKGLAKYGIVVKGWRPNPKSKGIKPG